MPFSSTALKEFLKKPEHFMLIVLLVLGFFLKLYALSLTEGQTLWWDEAEYMATAKHWAFGTPYELNPQRPPLFQLSAALLFSMGLPESSLIFFLVLLPALVLVYLVYLLGKTLYSPRVGLLSAFCSLFLWTYLFWSVRFQPDFFSLCFQLLALIYFWKLYKEETSLNGALAGLFSALAFYFKISALIIPLIGGVYALFVYGPRIIAKRAYWIFILTYFLTLAPFFIWQHVAFNNPLAFAPSYIEGTDKTGRDYGWQTLDYFYTFPGMLFFVFFIAYLIFISTRTLLLYDSLLQKEKRLDPSFFSFFALIISALFFIFYIQGVIEDRWVFIIAPFIFMFAAQSIYFLFDRIKNTSLSLAYLFIIILLSIFAISQFTHATQLIENKKDSYFPVQEASLFVKEQASLNDSVLSISYTQTTTYAERETHSYSRFYNASSFEEFILEKKPAYLIISLFEPHPAWIFSTGQLPNGRTAWILPYFNSSVILTPQNSIQNIDLQKTIRKEHILYELVYPTQTLTGAFVYKISYT